MKRILSEGSRDQHRYCVILAGGDGKRLRPLTQCVSADERPKQFCPFLGGWTPLGATMLRAARGFDADRTLYVVTRAHERYYTHELAEVKPWHTLIQPENKGTAPAILLSLLHLSRLDPEASVVFMPSDHHYRDEEGFLDGVHHALESAEGRAHPVILLGAAPTHPETGYGWIEPGPRIASTLPGKLFGVRQFWEKPSPTVARALFLRGCLWNTFVMAGRVETFLDMIRASVPSLYDSFRRQESAPGRLDLESLYRILPPADFSRDVLAARPSDLAVLDAGSVGWSDLGEPERVVRLISQLDAQCNWLAAWRQLQRYAS